MKKLPLIIVILVVLSLFATADFYLNNLGSEATFDLANQKPSETAQASQPDDVTGSIFKLNESFSGYTVVSQFQTKQVFEKIDLKNVGSVKVYHHRLELDKVDSVAEPAAEEGVDSETPEMDSEPEDLERNEPIFLYEIQGPVGQGSLTYLNVKLQFIAQINAVTETLNEEGGFGNNSFFFNDLNYENTAFLMAQIGDNLYGFQYSKADSKAYEDVQGMVETLMSK